MREINISQILSGDHTKAQLDVFHLLTSRPHIAESEMDIFYENMAKGFTDIGSAKDVSKYILCSPGLM